ncbi:MAG TPA: PEP-CTERM sorting domain-containing protein [Tepidisphaeraceae bacterium]|jgi:hypothetical protein|nr:PEP-CTERM sorting domain-containing protein [Tepidisphaeraceae bacterium]
MNYSNRTKKVLWSAAMSVGVYGVATRAMGQTTNANYTVNSNYIGEVESGGPYGSSTGYFELYGPSGTYPSYAVINYGTSGGTIPNSVVTAVSPNFTVDLTDEGYSSEDPNSTTLNFYLATDTTSNIGSSGTPASPLIYEANGTVGNGLVTPGSTGGFAAGSSLYYLGTGTYTPNGSVNAFNLSLTNATENPNGSQNITAAENYLTQEVQSGGSLRIVVTTNSTDAAYESVLGYTSASPPQLVLNATSTTAQPNDSTIYLTTIPTGAGNTSTNATINLGRVIESYADTQTFTVGNTSATGSALVLTNPNGLEGSSAPTGAANPIPANGTGTITVGFSAADTNGYTASYTATGSVVFQDADNTSSTITFNGSAYVVDQRKITAGGNSEPNQTAAISAGSILVGQTGSVGITLSTTNTNSNLPLGNDEGNDVLTTETLAAGAQSTAYTVDDPFTKAAVATISATSNSQFIFDSPAADINGVTANVAVATSGVYGDGHGTTLNGQTEYFNGNYTSFSDTAGMSNDGTTAGESDYADVYLQWKGYQAASVSSSQATVPVNSTATVTLTNAATNDNIASVTANSTTDTQNQGLRAGAIITGHNIVQTWNTGGWSLVSGFANNTTISGSTAPGDNNSYSTTGTIGFTQNSQMINGTYGAAIVIDLENNSISSYDSSTIQGVTANDLAPVTLNVQATVSSNPSVQNGAYTLNGGTLTAGATDLTGSFTQSGGQSTFANITGSGQLSITGGSATLAAGGGGSTISSLSISGGGSLDIGNNHLIISDPGGSIDSTIRGYLSSSYNGGNWNGPGINTSSPTGTTYGIGYADGADGGISGIGSGQLEVKYTLYGDANLDGSVNSIDFGDLAANFGKSGKVWDQGDFNYDGVVNSVDFGLLAGNFGKSVGGNADVTAADWAALDAFALANGLTADVPEPASMGILAVSGLAILSRRRRANRC